MPRDGHVLVLDNGAYCKRARPKLTTMMGRTDDDARAVDDAPVSPAELEATLGADASITHVGLIHCETGDRRAQSAAARSPTSARATARG